MTSDPDQKLLQAATAFIKGIEPIEDHVIIDFILGKLPPDANAALAELLEKDQELAARVADMREVIAPVLDPEYMAQAKARLFRQIARQDREKTLKKAQAIIRERAGESLAAARETIAGFIYDFATLCQAPIPAAARTADKATRLGQRLASRYPDPVPLEFPEGGECLITLADRSERWIIRARPKRTDDFSPFRLQLLDNEGRVHFSKDSDTTSRPAHTIEMSAELAAQISNASVSTVRLDFV